MQSENSSYQQRVGDWLIACFGVSVVDNKIERVHRMVEESLELAQSLGCTKEDAHKLVEYVFNRPPGEPFQEVGGVMVTLAALCRSNQIDMMHAANTELARVWNSMDQIRAKQSTKPQFSPLPGSITNNADITPTATQNDDKKIPDGHDINSGYEV